MADGGSFLSLDYILLGGVLGVGIYFFLIKKKKTEEAPAFKKLTVGATLDRSHSTDQGFISRMKNGGRSVVCFYGSQTGTAEEFAGRLAKDATRYGLKAIVADPEECDMEDLSKLVDIENSLAIFVMATYGEGDPTDNAQEFHDWLKDGGTQLDGLRYAVFGLGNKTYEHYNATGKFVDTKLAELGADRVFEIGLGDDDANIEEDFVTWREKFWPAVCEKFNISSVGEDISIRQYSLTVHDDIPPEKLFTGEPARLNSLRNQKPPYDTRNPFLAPIVTHKELHRGGDRSCMHIEFDLTGSKMRYDAGDHVAVFPTNDPELVEKLGQRLGVDLGQCFSLVNLDEDASKKNPFPCPTTYRTALLHYLDITSSPRTNVIKELAEYAEDPKDKDFLLKLSSTSPEGKELYNDWILVKRRTIQHVLEDLPSVKPPIDHLCELLPRLHARYYSISSSPKVNPNILSITAVLVDYETQTKRRIVGVASGWLKKRNVITEEHRPTVPIYIRKSTLRLPFKPNVPVIMIGPGTGIAPFRGFIQDRSVAKKDGKPVGDTILYFGCRRKDEDYIYQDELNDYKNDGVISKLYVAFSRDQGQKVYVQHLLSQHGEEVWKILEEGGHLYVCGDAKHMAHDVDEVLQKIVSTAGQMDSAAAQDYLKKLRSRGRYACDVWS